MTDEQVEKICKAINNASLGLSLSLLGIILVLAALVLTGMVIK